ncbi:MAG TPA: 16S rRNA (cytosine(967)-C(5))-methyltransferase RsmB [Marinagarivorans sp.]|nr:16S rRNA (cytosine(967)-C(5))-methyltransferase RsmB [Marinagarivorans sp.]HNG58572.1 16S rRNA (cytosine(967)-C(5))-methyltransferase RsmB [Cellvibrionaceae bacterium]
MKRPALPQDVRALAALALHEVFDQGRSLSQVLPEYSQACPERDRGLLKELCFGSLRYATTYLLVLQELIPTPLKRKDGDVQALLLMGLYQLEHTRIPDHAALSATVEASRLLHKDWAAGFINGVLRRYQRERELLAEKFAKNPNYRYAHPQWLLDRIRSAWPDHWQEVLEANNQHPPMTLRVNSQKTDRATYLAKLAAAEIDASPCAYSPVGITLAEALPVEALPGFSEGEISVQDEAAQLAAYLVAPKAGERLLDACCAPGGKTCHLLEIAPAADLLAIDIDPTRLQRVTENLDRLGLEAQLKAWDLTDVNGWWDGREFDAILLDAACSATGVVRRHPDIKHLRRASDLAPLAKLQQRLLKALWQTLKPGGRLVYATCSVLPDENSKQVQEFLRLQPDAEHSELAVDWGIPQAFGRQLLPQAGGQDGFYYAVLHKAERSNGS